jgi:hypothetical protein
MFIQKVLPEAWASPVVYWQAAIINSSACAEGQNPTGDFLSSNNFPKYRKF